MYDCIFSSVTILYMYYLELLKSTSTEHGEEERDDYEVARSSSYPHSELERKVNFSQSKAEVIQLYTLR